MSLRSYEKAARSLSGEWQFDQISDPFVELRKRMADYTYAEWESWRMKHINEIVRLVASTPKQQQQFLEKMDEDKRVLMKFAAAQHCIAAAEFLKLAEECQAHIGIGNRDMIAMAGKFFLDIRKSLADAWPAFGSFSGYKDAWKIKRSEEEVL